MNYKFEQYEETISLKKFMIACLQQWKVMIVAAIVGALLLGVLDCIMQLTKTNMEFSIGSVLTKTIIGFLCGIIAVCGCVLLKILIIISFGKYLYSMEDLCQQLNIPILLSFYTPVDSRKEKNVIDLFIERLDDREYITDEKAIYELLTAKLDLMICEKNTVLLIGSEDRKKLYKIEKKLNQFRYTDTIQYIAVPNLLQNLDGILKLKDSVVVLVASESNTRKSNIKNILTFLSQINADLVGAIIL